MGDLLNCVITFDSIRKKTNFTYTAKGLVAYRGSYRDFTLEYSGADIHVKYGFLHEEITSSLKEDLNNIVGYGPFERSHGARFRNIDQIIYSVHGTEVVGKEIVYKK